ALAAEGLPSRPSRTGSSRARSPPSRLTASSSARSVEKTSCPSSGGGWLVTSWVSNAVAMSRRYRSGAHPIRARRSPGATRAPVSRRGPRHSPYRGSDDAERLEDAQDRADVAQAAARAEHREPTEHRHQRGLSLQLLHFIPPAN